MRPLFEQDRILFSSAKTNQIFVIMKKTLVLSILLVLCLPMLASEPLKGYQGEITLSGLLGVDHFRQQMPLFVSLETNHGARFGNGWYVGGGIGADFYEDVTFYIPVYSEVRYYVGGTPLYLTGRTGISFSKGLGLRPFIMSGAGAGLRFGHWSVGMTMQRLHSSYMDSLTVPVPELGLRMGIGYHF